MKNFEVVVSENTDLTGIVESCLNKKIINIKVESFADTETCIKFSEINLLKNKNLYIVQQFSFPDKNSSCTFPINEQLFRFLLLCDFLKKSGAKKIIAILPYLPYSRQDKSFYGRSVGAISMISKFLKFAGIEQVISFDLHEPSIKSDFDLNLKEMVLVDFWAKFIRNKFVDEKICIVSPDHGGIKRAKNICKLVGADFAHVEKKRVDSDKTVALNVVGDIKDKKVIVIDDILDTGMTAINACRLLKEKGAKSIIGCFAHGIFTNDAVQKLKSSDFDRIFVTDTIKFRDDILKSKKISIVSIGDLLCDHLKNPSTGLG